MITRVRGNQMNMLIDLKKLVVHNEAGAELEDFDLADGDKVIVRLCGREYAYTYDAIFSNEEGNRNKLFIHDNGRLENGVYGLEVLISKGSEKYRAKHRNVLRIVEYTDDADVDVSTGATESEAVEAEARVLTDGNIVNIYPGTNMDVLRTMFVDLENKQIIQGNKVFEFSLNGNRPITMSNPKGEGIRMYFNAKGEDKGSVGRSEGVLEIENYKGKSLYLFDDGKLAYGTLMNYYEILDAENWDEYIKLDGKVDKVDGMGLSENNYTDEDKEEINSLREDVDYIRQDALPGKVDSNRNWKAGGSIEYILRRVNRTTGEDNAVGLTWDGDRLDFWNGEGADSPTINGKRIATTEDVPTKVSELTNDSGLITEADALGMVQELADELLPEWASERDIINLFNKQ